MKCESATFWRIIPTRNYHYQNTKDYYYGEKIIFMAGGLSKTLVC